MTVVGFVVHYKGEFNGGAFVPAGSSFLVTKGAMQQSRPHAIVIVTPVTEIPEWVRS